jgi:hypothetical protein
MCTLKKTVQRDFDSVFWHIWIGLRLNMNRFGFYKFCKAPTIQDQRWHFPHGLREFISEDYIFQIIFISSRNLRWIPFLPPHIYFRNLFINHKKVLKSCWYICRFTHNLFVAFQNSYVTIAVAIRQRWCCELSPRRSGLKKVANKFI